MGGSDRFLSLSTEIPVSEHQSAHVDRAERLGNGGKLEMGRRKPPDLEVSVTLTKCCSFSMLAPTEGDLGQDLL